MKLVNKVFLLIPVLLILFNLWSGFVYGFNPGIVQLTPQYQVWKVWMHRAVLLYVFCFAVMMLSWLQGDKRSWVSFRTTFTQWFIGFVGSVFSYVISGIIVDVGWLIYFIGLKFL